MSVQKISITAATLALLAGASVWAFAQQAQPGAGPAASQTKVEEQEGMEEEVITLDKAPEAVRAAAIKLAGDAKNITKVIKEEDDEDVVQYEIEYTEGEGAAAVACAAILSIHGNVMEIERSTPTTALPAAVMEALRKDYPKATFANPFTVTKTYYEVEIVIDGKKHEVKVDASGNIEDESHGGDEAGKDAGKGSPKKDGKD